MSRKKRWAYEDDEETRSDFERYFSRPIDIAVDKYYEEHPEEAGEEVVSPDLREIEDLIPPIVKRDERSHTAKKLKHLGEDYDNMEDDPNDGKIFI